MGGVIEVENPVIAGQNMTALDISWMSQKFNCMQFILSNLPLAENKFSLVSKTLAEEQINFYLSETEHISDAGDENFLPSIKCSCCSCSV